MKTFDMVDMIGIVVYTSIMGGLLGTFGGMLCGIGMVIAVRVMIGWVNKISTKIEKP